MKYIVLFPVWFIIVNSVAQAESLNTTVSSLAHRDIILRAPLKCENLTEEQESNMSALLQADYAAEIPKAAGVKVSIKKLKSILPKDCRLDCTCYPLVRLYEAQPLKLQKKLPLSKVNKQLEKMTDESYQTCAKKIKNICDLPEIKDFYQRLKSFNQ